ncbi:AMP-dependent synthetase [Nocardioides marmoriginsengisoli]|uniref:AMP-dependent synthetase n=1 Tax=Nocardioides marmoriginsengisoli TaxID=661483 RepID=A0A3N0CMN1_9ACTN|nr:AMP-binding protein [Nocardioides marmoriginsengisoli]RNL64316.1 AMP-dependent synthetase [Nocardioides marmoriginsengisoli]
MTVLREYPADLPVLDLAGHGDAVALVLGERSLTYAELDLLVDEQADRLGIARRLILLECANELEPLVTYLAALRGRHPVLLVPRQTGPASRQQLERLIAEYDPDVRCTRGRDGWELESVREISAHELHPDLAVLLGTSGSTGTPKLVRLSRENLRANAAAIASYLKLGPDARAATTLPFQYCYGLSVLNSHLYAGGSVFLTERSVVEPEFWDEFAAAGATSFAGVPYTYELLDRAGVDWTRQPGLRQATQAGGRMPPARVRDLAERAADCGVDLVVMYGQTEATARMAYLPPHLAADRPECIGVPIDGGDLRLDDGELVYTGPNVMLGYARTPADLALGRTVTELRTGDLAVQHDDGLFEIVGRSSRMAKLFGVRLDLDHAETMLAEQGVTARLVATPDRLRAFVLDEADQDRAAQLLAGQHCVPGHAITVQTLTAFPVTATGKPDLAALGEVPLPATTGVDVRGEYAIVFGRPVAPEDSFVSLGGDSLSYVETYVRLERLLGAVPADWPSCSVAELSALRVRRRRWWAAVETPVLVRALAIVLIVGSHTELWNVMGGAHVLLAAYGFALGRFALSSPTRADRLLALGRTIRDTAIPVLLWLVPVTLLLGVYNWPAVFLVHGFVGGRGWSDDWHLWFLESALWSTVGVAALVAIPAVDRVIRRYPFAAAGMVLAGALALRASFDYSAGHLERFAIERTAWFVALGWLVFTARTLPQRLLVTALVPVTVLGFIPDDLQREWVIIVGILAILWIPTIPVPRPLDRLVGLLASASLFVYLTHWQVYPHLENRSSVLAWAASLAVGVLAWWLYTRGRRLLVQRGPQSAPAGVTGALRSRSSRR